MTFFGGPNSTKERYMIKDSEGYIMSSKKYIRDNPNLFRYIGHFRIGSTVFHTFEFLTAP